METVREVLRLEEYPGTRAHYVAVQAALAEVERWERDRARLERQLAEAIAQDYCTICGAALGEGQDSDQPKRGKLGGSIRTELTEREEHQAQRAERGNRWYHRRASRSVSSVEDAA